MNEDTRVEWREWGQDAFDEAAAAEKPVLLSLTATWCDSCHEMDTVTYGEPRIAANLNDDFVPVRVDVDRHPRVRERYNMGGFPSTVFTTPAGEVLTGTTFLGPDGMRQVLESVREMWAEKGADAGRIPRALADDPTPAGEVTEAIEEQLAGQLGQQFDDDHAGWGDGAKFPLPRTVEFALKRERQQALRTLDAIHRELFDDVEGGFFRYADGRDWQNPHHEKRLDGNAALVRAFANAYLYTGDEHYRDTADAAIDFLVDQLWTGVAFGGSLGPAAGQEYYAHDADGRAEATGPRTDLTAYAGGNAVAADALATFHAYTDDDRARTYARRTLEYLGSDLVDDGAVTHFRTGDETGETGLLDDQAHVAGAFARAAQVFDPTALDTARAVADYAIETLYDDGPFLDGPDTGAGLLDRPFRPLDGNVAMADALLDIAALTGDERYREVAHDTVAAFAGASDRMGVQVAAYGAVAGRLCRPALVIAVGGDPGVDLHRAALRVADHETVVRPSAPDVAAGEAVVTLGDETWTATTPDDLMTKVAAATDQW